jgi:hypothetical protein
MFVLVDDHGSPLGEFPTRAEAVRALEELVRADPSAADECGVVELDKAGRRVGEPVTVRSTAAA